MSQRLAGPVVRVPSGEDVVVGSRLGWLYLEQGHLDEAEAIFEAVLRWRPEETEARSGLDQARRRRLEAAAEPARRVASAGSSRRKIARLEAYLARVRRSRRPSEPRDVS